MSLVEFLEQHPLDVSAEILSWCSSDAGAITIELRANPWWLGASNRGSSEDGILTIECRRVEDSWIRIGYSTECGCLLATHTHPRLWRFGTFGTLFGASPIIEPDAVLSRFTKAIEEDLDAGYTIVECIGVGIDEWLKVVSENASYHLLSGPLPIVERCAHVLDTPYTLVRGPERSANLTLVQVEDSFIVCSEAIIALSVNSSWTLNGD